MLAKQILNALNLAVWNSEVDPGLLVGGRGFRVYGISPTGKGV